MLVLITRSWTRTNQSKLNYRLLQNFSSESGDNDKYDRKNRFRKNSEFSDLADDNQVFEVKPQKYRGPKTPSQKAYKNLKNKAKYPTTLDVDFELGPHQYRARPIRATPIRASLFSHVNHKTELQSMVEEQVCALN